MLEPHRYARNSRLLAVMAALWALTWVARAETPDPKASLIINEFMAVNSTLTDVRPVPAVHIYTHIAGERIYADWIELKNQTGSPVSLANWNLTDDPDNLLKWSFPAGVTIPAGGYLIVYASNKDSDKYGYPFIDDLGHLHTNFELSLRGEYLALIRPDGSTVEHAYRDYPRQRGLRTYGVTAQASQEIGHLIHATPGAANADIYAGIVEDVQFDHAHGFYDLPFSLALSCATSGATIRYTLDTSNPTQTHGLVYTDPILITRTTCLRAAAFKSDHLPSAMTTQTYLFLDDVPGQATHPTGDGQVTPAGYPDQWTSGGDKTSGDYQVDPDITDPAGSFGNLYAATFKEDLLSIPSISVVAPIEDLFGPSGVYVNESQDGTERAGSVELLDPLAAETFTMNCGIRMQGGASEVAGGTTLNRWKCKKLSLRLMFRGLYGGQLQVPLFGVDGADSFNTIVLDSRPQNSWVHSDSLQRTRGDYVRDQVASNTQLALGGLACHGRPLHVYLNGLYWGLYWMHERPDASFAASYLGGDKEDYDVIKHVWNNPIDGDNTDYLAMFHISPTSPDHVTAWHNLQEKLDVTDFIDYMITNYYLGNGDWDHKNWYATHNRFDPEGRWRWHMWDGEHVMGEGEKSWFGRPDNTGYRVTARAPTGLHWDWIRNDEYRMCFADRVHRHFFHDGPLTPDNFLALFNHLTDEIDRAMVGESARWGDYRRSTPYTRNNEWLRECERLRRDYIPGRRDRVLKQFTGVATQYPKNPAWVPSTVAPEFHVDGRPQYGGYASTQALLTMSGESQTVIWYTLDGTDPRLPGGAVNTLTAQEFSTGLVLNRSVTVKARARSAQGEWSPLSHATYGVTPVAENLRITELMYHPDPAGVEFVVLKNIGTEPLELTGVRFTEGVTFAFTGLPLEPGAHAVIVEDVAAFSSRYPDFQGVMAGAYDGRLSNSGETIALVDALDQVVQRFTYQDHWYPSTDGQGYALTPVDPSAAPDQWNHASGWRASSSLGGTPGMDD
jgi:hypothetical protein